jgi:AmmeMemoRadiSam system protein B
VHGRTRHSKVVKCRLDLIYCSKKCFVMGPTHRVSLQTCAISPATQVETPFGNLNVCRSIYEQMQKEFNFPTFSLKQDEAEHSLEMHYPWIYYTLGPNVEVIPIVVGDFKKDFGAKFSKFLSPFLEDPDVFFVISSDFCHWGERFDFTYYNQEDGEIHQSIEKLDRLGMKQISTLKSENFEKYLEQCENTICGRNPIRLLMKAVEQCKTEFKMDFVHYSQSSKCTNPKDSSVSYASGLLYQK